MIAILTLLRSLLGSLFRSRARITAENLLLRHQLNIARRHGPKRAHLSNWDRWGLVWVYRIVPDALDAVSLVRPETVIRWHRQGFRAFWRWKSRSRGGRPRIPQELRDLVREMSRANPLWGAPRIHGELLKLGIEVSQSTVANYMPRCSRPPSQSWKTFRRNHENVDRRNGRGVLSQEGLPRLRRSASSCSIAWLSLAMIAGSCSPSASRLIRPRRGLVAGAGLGRLGDAGRLLQPFTDCLQKLAD